MTILRNSHITLTHCTAQMEDGRFCDAVSLADAPFPICRDHADEMLSFYYWKSQDTKAAEAQHLIDEVRQGIGIARREMTKAERSEEKVLQEQAVVYYVDLGDRIKIGTTISTIERMRSLRVDIDTALLVTEPGSYDLEKMRHRQFASARIGRREDFRKVPELISHIGMLAEHFGPPKRTKRYGVLQDQPA